MSVLPDTSIWVGYLRGARRKNGSGHHLDSLLSTGQVVLCGPVLAEILAGTNQEARELIWPQLEKLHFIDLDKAAYRLIGEVSAELRLRGATVPLTDISIAAAAVVGQTELWSVDRDFDRIAAVVPTLKLHRPS